MPVNFCPRCRAKVPNPLDDYCRKCDARLYPAEEYEDAEEHDDDDDAPRKLVKGAKRRETVRAVASIHRQLMASMLVYFLMVVVSVMLPQPLKVVPALVGLPAALFAVVSAFRLGAHVAPGGVGILLGFLMLVPCVNLISLLRLNSMATQLLRENNVRVGLFGAKSSDLP